MTELESKPVSIDAGDRIWKVTNYDHTYLGRVNLSRAIVSSDNSVYAQLTDLVGPKAIVKTAHDLGIRSQLAPYFSIGLGSGAVSPLEMARAYATFANDGRRVDGSEFGNRPRVVETVERIARDRVEDERADPEAGDGRGPRRAPHRASSRTSCRSAPESGRRFPGSRSLARPERRTTTATPGSSATRPSSSSRCGSDIPDALAPMLTEFNGEPVAGGTLPAHDLEGVRREGGGGRSTRSFDSPPYLGGSSTWVVRRDGEWQLDNGYCRGSRLIAYFSGEAPDKEADCKPNEVSVPLVVGHDEGRGRGDTRRAAARGERRLRAREGGQAPGDRRRARTRARVACLRTTR